MIVADNGDVCVRWLGLSLPGSAGSCQSPLFFSARQVFPRWPGGQVHGAVSVLHDSPSACLTVSPPALLYSSHYWLL